MALLSNLELEWLRGRVKWTYGEQGKALSHIQAQAEQIEELKKQLQDYKANEGNARAN
jgi:hypothetical protein